LESLEGRVESFILEKTKKSLVFESVQSAKLSYNRFDVAFKLLCLEWFLRKEVRSDCREKYYKEHIKAFTLGKFVEPGNQAKSDYQSYLQAFEDIFNSVRSNGFDQNLSIVPLAEDGSILNGAHRNAAAVFLGLNYPVLKTSLRPAHYGHEFFRDRGVPEHFLSAAAETFAEYDNGCFVALVWPTAKGCEREVHQILGKVVYKKEVWLNLNGAHNLLTQVYSGEGWLGQQNKNYPGARGKVEKCFPSPGVVRVYVFQSDSLEEVLSLKERIRQVFGNGKHSVHTTDTKAESLKVCQMLLNENSVHFLNNASPNKYVETAAQIAYFKSAVQRSGGSFSDYAIDSGMVMAVYGLRSAHDVDYVTVSNNLKDMRVDAHDTELQLHGVEAKDLIDDRSNFFWYEGVKFLCLQQVRNMKAARGEAKDLNDLRRIDVCLKDEGLIKLFNSIRYFVTFKKSQLINNSKSCIKTVLEYLGVFEKLKIHYDKVRARKRR
jgi:hypothetical protein